tara:strand:- start:1334 stop:2056 length:723 start_codon:yes stop_codon:yes gene_type:complete
MEDGVWKDVFKTSIFDGTWKETFKLKGSLMTLSGVTTYTSNGTYTVPQGVRYVKVTANGAGGGGGGTSAYTSGSNIITGSGQNGGPGGRAVSDLYEVKPGNVITFDIGTGGGPGTNNMVAQTPQAGTPGTAGGATTISIGAGAPNGVSSGTVIAQGLGGGGGSNVGNTTVGYVGSSGSGSFNTNNTHNEGAGTVTTGGGSAGSTQRGIVGYYIYIIVYETPNSGSNGTADLYTYGLANIS